MMGTQLKKLDAVLYRGESIMIVTLVLLALFSGIMQVVLRYIFNTGFHWNEPVFVTMTIWAMLFGASLAVRNHIHARVEIFVENLPQNLAVIAGFFSYLSSFFLTAFYFYCGLLYVQFVNSMDIISMETGVPDAITYAIVPIAMTLMSLRYLILIIELFNDFGTLHGANNTNNTNKPNSTSDAKEV